MSDKKQGFSQGIGRWLGTAEVYDGQGRFVGNATDQRHVQQIVGQDRVRIDLSFVGPFKFSGHYTIADHKSFRLYEGPANYGYAETLSSGLIDANAYWPLTGLSQRFFLMVLPGGDRQLSLALMSRGENLIYVVVGEYNRVAEEGYSGIPSLINGTSYDMADDPAGGRTTLLLHRPGTWTAQLQTLDHQLNPLPTTDYQETISPDGNQLHITQSGLAFDPAGHTHTLRTNNWQAWSTSGDTFGSYSLSGGRALSGQFHYPASHLRLWRREVVSHDGTTKALLHTWYRGGQRLGIQFGLAHFTPA